ncbi:alpha/beta fold hydrolase [Starkeya sp. 3C]|uniref:Alpha/beta fold hydrolase n=1 Tax=Ancylobacter moscoviensis TaxID=2597768 RepID=A0ABY3DRZ8_9HYPH|nr:alpha/beta fold hydrolase [Ancylobacter moscoviensis]TSJ61635.1 alpha/beta fold hydrolase [Ancylobacter moscoviensis]
MATFILIHGSWQWGGCFMKVANILAAAGHAVITPDLASHGFDTTPTAAVTDISIYAAPARAALEEIEGKVILVGHSVGGATCTWLGEEMHERIEALVYLTGFMAPNGKTARDFVMTPTYLKDPAIVETQGMLRLGKEGLGLDLARRDLISRSLYSDCTEHDIDRAMANVVRVTPHAPFTAVSAITPRRFGRLPRHYVECLQDRGLPLAVQREMQAAVPGAQVHQLDTGHSPFLSAPEEVAEILLNIR